MFSIVIPVRNDEANLARCLASLERMDASGAQFEVIVVDNGSTDRSLEAARGFARRLPLQVLEKPGVYISAVRNCGAAHARGQYLAFLDSDCEVPAGWLKEASGMIARSRPGVFGSYYLIPDGSSWIARHWYGKRVQWPRGEVVYLPAGDLFVEREMFGKLNGFNETIQTNEDYELCQRARVAGLAIICVPELAVVHWGTPQSLAGFFRKNRWHGMHVFRIFLRNLPALYNFRAVALALYTLACMGALVVGAIVALMQGRFSLLAGALAALLLPPLLVGIHGAAVTRSLASALPMAALSLVYAVARASSLLDWRNWLASSAVSSQQKTSLADH